MIGEREMKVNQKKSFRQEEQQPLARWGGGWTQFGRLDRKPGTLSHVYSVVYPFMEFRDIKHHKERHRKKEKNLWSYKKKEEYSTNMKEYSPVHRVHTEWQWPLSGVYFIMMKNQPRLVRDAAPPPFTICTSTHHVQSSGVRSSWEGKYTLPLFLLYPYICTLWSRV